MRPTSRPTKPATARARRHHDGERQRRSGCRSDRRGVRPGYRAGHRPCARRPTSSSTRAPSTQAAAIIGAIVSANQAKVISSSYGSARRSRARRRSTPRTPLFQEAAAQGQSFFISSGDSGSAMCFQAIDQQSQYVSCRSSTPADSRSPPASAARSSSPAPTPTRTTTRRATHWWRPSGTRAQHHGRASATGGGISSFFTMPSYQSSAPATLGVVNPDSSAQPCGGDRQLPRGPRRRRRCGPGHRVRHLLVRRATAPRLGRDRRDQRVRAVCGRPSLPWPTHRRRVAVSPSGSPTRRCTRSPAPATTTTSTTSRTSTRCSTTRATTASPRPGQRQ